MVQGAPLAALSVPFPAASFAPQLPDGVASLCVQTAADGPASVPFAGVAAWSASPAPLVPGQAANVTLVGRGALAPWDRWAVVDVRAGTCSGLASQAGATLGDRVCRATLLECEAFPPPAGKPQKS